jgi:hypothetical protein
MIFKRTRLSRCRMIWLHAPPPPPPSPVIMTVRRHTGRPRKERQLAYGRGGKGCGREAKKAWPLTVASGHQQIIQYYLHRIIKDRTQNKYLLIIFSKRLLLKLLFFYKVTVDLAHILVFCYFSKCAYSVNYFVEIIFVQRILLIPYTLRILSPKYMEWSKNHLKLLSYLK